MRHSNDRCPARGSRPVGKAALEELEGRRLMSAATGISDLAAARPSGSEFVYVESNNPEPGQNAVIALLAQPVGWVAAADRQIPDRRHGVRQRDARTGAGRLRPGGGRQPRRAIPVRGQPGERLDRGLPRPRGRPVCSGSARTRSGGTQPVSVGLAGDHLYVANRGDCRCRATPRRSPRTTPRSPCTPTRASPVPGSTVTLPIGLSPAQTLISRDGRFVFGDNFAIPGTTPPLAR